LHHKLKAHLNTRREGRVLTTVEKGDGLLLRDLISDRAKQLGYSGLRQISAIAKELNEPVIDFSIGDVNFNTETRICNAATEAMKEGKTHYTPVLGLLSLREALSEKMRKENQIEASPETDICVAAGGSEGLFVSFLATINQGDEVLVEDPTYALFTPMVKICGGTVSGIPLKEENNYQLTSDMLRDKIGPKTKMLVLCNPHNPVGRVRTKEELQAIADVCIEKDILVLSDETYEKIVFDNHKHVSIGALPQMHERTITLISLSKIYAMTGWRLAYLVAEKEIMNNIGKMHAYNVSAAQTPGQIAAIEAITGPQDEVYERVEEYRRRRDLIVKRLNEMEGISCNSPEGSFYAFPNISQLGKDSFEVAKHLVKQGKVLAVHGTAYGDHGEGYIRFNFGKTPIEDVEEGMNRMEKALKSL
jgi:aminotransferase